MKIQTLAIIGVLIILPLTIVLETYTKMLSSTINTQVLYDTKLQNATYDALESMTMNYDSNVTSDIITSRVEDIEASINSFYNSLANQFVGSGLDRSSVFQYVPCVLYNSYDGYYIYTSYNNTIFSNDDLTKEMKEDNDLWSSDLSSRYVVGVNDTKYEASMYKDGDKLFGVKTYSYYIQNYKKDADPDREVYINYTLDSYITINIRDGDKMVHKSGYLLQGLTGTSRADFAYDGFSMTDSEGEIDQILYYSKPDGLIKTALEGKGLADGLDGGELSSSTGTWPPKKDGSEMPGQEINLEFDDLPDETASDTIEVGKKVVYPLIKLNGQTKYWTGNEFSTTSTHYWSIISFLKDSTDIEQNSGNDLTNAYISKYRDDLDKNISSDHERIFTENQQHLDLLQEAYEFRQFLNSGASDATNQINVKDILRNICIGDADDKIYNSASGSKYEFQEVCEAEPNVSFSLYDLLMGNNEDGVYLEDYGSIFNTHRQDVIKKVVEDDLREAIVNYANSDIAAAQSGKGNTISYQMPRITDEDWERIANNVTMTTFLQGFNLGTKVYNNYCTLINNYTKEFVSDNSIKFVYNGKLTSNCEVMNDECKYYHEFYEKHIYETDTTSLSDACGILNIDLISQNYDRAFKCSLDGRFSASSTGSVDTSAYSDYSNYYIKDISINSFARPELMCLKNEVHDEYANIKVSNNGGFTYKQFFEELVNNTSGTENSRATEIAKIYYRALFRERQGMYRIYNPNIAIDY